MIHLQLANLEMDIGSAIWSSTWSGQPYMPHGHCYLWQTNLVGLHVLSDLLIAIAYFSIPLILLYFVSKRHDLPFHGIFFLFSAFIIACGTTHLMAILTLWYPAYWLAGLVKAITAGVSIYTAVVLARLLPNALALPSLSQWQAANQLLQQEVTERQQAEAALRQSESRLKVALEGAEVVCWEFDLQNRQFSSLGEHLGTCWLPSGWHVVEGQMALRWIYPADRRSVLKAIGETMRYQSELKIEHRLVLPHQPVAWVFTKGRLVLDEQGEPSRIVGISMNITTRKRVSNALHNLVVDTASVTGNQFFPVLVRQLSCALDVDHVLLTERQGQTLKTLAFWSECCLQTNVEYELSHTPCQRVIEQGRFYCPTGVIQQFPLDADLVKMEADSYMGVALKTCLGEVLGHLCIVSKQPLSDPSRYEEILQVFATRAAAEVERQRAETALRQSEEQFRLLAENMSDLVCLHDRDTRFLYVSPSVQALLGLSPEELIHQLPYELLHPADRDRIYTNAYQPTIQGSSAPITYRIRHQLGHYIWVETLTKPILDQQQQVVHFLTTSRNVTEKMSILQQLEHDALHDALTELPNRTLLMQRLACHLKQVPPSGSLAPAPGVDGLANLGLNLSTCKLSQSCNFAVLFIDLDRFKLVNDSLGHLVGDQLLVTIARKLQNVARGSDLIARVGGDEFVMLLEDIESIHDAIRVAERILRDLQLPVNIGHQTVTVGASIGIVQGSSTYQHASDLIRDADIAMYQAKKEGRSGFTVFNPVMHGQAVKQLQLENDLRTVLKQQAAGHESELKLYYQPIVSLANQALVGFEALVRWHHPRQGLIPPAEFIAIAEETGLIVPLGFWILQEAVQQLAHWRSQAVVADHVRVSVNLSVQQLQELTLVRDIDRILTQAGLPSRCLTLEITESLLIQDFDRVNQLLTQLCARSIQISIDDFGTGFSSLAYLHRLPVNNLKIDQSFVQTLGQKTKNKGIVQTIVHLADELGIDAIAEGIETPEQLQHLQELGCEVGQGYLFMKPLLPQDVEARLNRMCVQQ